MRHILLLVLCLALATGAAVSAAQDTAKTSEFSLTKGDTLTAAEDSAVRATLLSYLAAVQKLDWRKAATYVDRESFLAAVEPLIAGAAPDPALRANKRREIFGVSTYDSLEKKPLPDLFFSMMTYAMSVDPTRVAILEKAQIELIGSRKVRGKVHVAYSLTLPAESDTLQPYVSVTADRLRKVGDDWKIVIIQEHGTAQGEP